MPIDDVEHGVQVAGAAELVDRLGVTALGQQPVGSLAMQLPQALGIAVFQAVVEAVAQGRVVAVFGVTALGDFDDQVQALQLA
ncbi:hypothetical protein D3C76_1218880 [compost metagenome]